MIKTALGKWGWFNQIIFNANKTTFESFFLLFPGSYYIKSYRTQALNIARLDPNKDISQIEN